MLKVDLHDLYSTSFNVCHPDVFLNIYKVQIFFSVKHIQFSVKIHSMQHVSAQQSHHQPDDGSDEMGRACSKHGREERYIQNFDGGNLRERVHLEDR